MKIYTYYEDLGVEHSNRLLKIWKQSWQQNGFIPIVLSKTDCIEHPYYTSYSNELRKISIEMSGKPPTEYGLACWLRWLAYSTQNDEEFYVSDYDVINHNFKPTKPLVGLHMLDHACPCIASGRPKDFEWLCKTLIHTVNNNKDFFKKIYKTMQKAYWFNDQEFFEIVNELDHNLIKMTRNRETFLSTPLMHEFWKKPLVHYGSGLCDLYLQRCSKKFTPQARNNLIEEFLNKNL